MACWLGAQRMRLSTCVTDPSDVSFTSDIHVPPTSHATGLRGLSAGAAGFDCASPLMEKVANNRKSSARVQRVVMFRPRLKLIGDCAMRMQSTQAIGTKRCH